LIDVFGMVLTQLGPVGLDRHRRGRGEFPGSRQPGESDVAQLRGAGDGHLDLPAGLVVGDVHGHVQAGAAEADVPERPFRRGAGGGRGLGGVPLQRCGPGGVGRHTLDRLAGIGHASEADHQQQHGEQHRRHQHELDRRGAPLVVVHAAAAMAGPPAHGGPP
jgi:hypothetical protein